MKDIAAALLAWERLLGAPAVVQGRELGHFTMNVTGYARSVPAALRLTERDQVREVVAIARRFGVPLYPISTGRNWGLGSRLPVRDGTVIVDLSRLNRILALDTTRSTVVVEPGVTQGQLADYVNREAPHLMVNVTGSATATSVVGNTLDRGIGYFSPRADDLVGLEVVQGSGDTLRIGEWHTAGEHHGPHWHHGIGPGLLDMFVQSNLGIVTAAAVRLRRRPVVARAFRVSVREDAQAVDLVDALGRLHGDSVLTSSTRIFDGEWMRGAADDGPAWIAFGAIAGRGTVVRALTREVRAGLRGVGQVELAPDRPDLKSTWWPSALAAMHGQPTDQSVISWAERVGVTTNPDDLDNTEFGMLCDVWSVGFTGRAGYAFAEQVRKTAAPYHVRPCISLAVLDAYSLEAACVVLFNRGSAARTRAAHACAEEIREALLAAGAVPHRTSVEGMSRLTTTGDAYWSTAARIKRALDPDLIIAPGRYNML